jgi:DHA1 family tetracycline resistance protein-like MFS transporter
MNSGTKKQLLPYALLVLLGYIGFSLPLPILPEMFLNPNSAFLSHAYSIEKKMAILGLFMTAYPIGQLVGCPVLGRFSDRFGRRKVILSSLCGNAVGYMITAFSIQQGSLMGTFGGLLLCGFSEGNVALAQSVISDITPVENKAENFGWLNFFTCTGFIIGPLIGGALSEPHTILGKKIIFDFSTPFWLASLLTLCALSIVYFQTVETPVTNLKKEGFFGSFKQTLKNVSMRRYFLANFFAYLGMYAFWRFLPVFLERRFQFSSLQLAYVLAYESAAYAVALMVGMKYVSKKATPHAAVSLFSFFMGAMLFIVVLPSSPWYLLVTIPLIGGFIAIIMTNIAVLVSNTAAPGLQGQTMGSLTAVQVLAEVLTSILGGIVASFNPAIPLYMGGAMIFICGGIMMRKKDV